jgi:uncharacterized membrane protein
MTDVHHVTITIRTKPAEVYAFISDPRNLPRWASGLAGAKVHPEGDEWVTESGLGKVHIKFAAKNSFGVADHDVRLPSGDTVHNPLRVLPHGKDSEVVFTLFRAPGVTDDQLNEDKQTIEKDLATLKKVLEG